MAGLRMAGGGRGLGGQRLPALVNRDLTTASCALEVRLGQLDDLVAAAVEDCLEHEQAESLCRRELDLRWHDELLLRGRHIDERRAGVRERRRWPVKAQASYLGRGGRLGPGRAADERARWPRGCVRATGTPTSMSGEH